MDKNESVPFVQYLYRLLEDENRAALAALRRGLGKPPGTSSEMYRWVVPWLPSNSRPWEENKYFILASLFACHPEPGGEGTIGTTMKRVATATDSESIEHRFVALLNCHTEDLPNHLRHAVSLAKSRTIPINWNQLFKDLSGWSHPDRYVQRRWARDFWALDHQENASDQKTSEEAWR